LKVSASKSATSPSCETLPVIKTKKTMKIKILLLAFILCTSSAFGQSKKEIIETLNIRIDVIDIAGNQVAIISTDKQSGMFTKQFNTVGLPSCNYFVRLQANGKTAIQKLSLNH
jgi:hypothetical protein